MTEAALAEIYGSFAKDATALLEQRQAIEKRAMESKRFHDTCELIATVCTPESAGLVVLTLWQEGIDLSKTQLHRALMKRCGRVPTWVPSYGTPFQYCTHSFEPQGYVTEGTAMTEGGYRKSYRISAAGKETVAAIGLFSDWGLQYPQFSVQPISGTKAGSGTVRAPEVRINIMLDLLTHPRDGSVGVHEIRGLSEIPGKVLDTTLNSRLLHSGWVTAESVLDNNDRTYKVIDPEYRSDWPYDQLLPETKAVYEFLATLQPGDTFTYQQALNYVMARLGEGDSVIDLADIRKQLSKHLGSRLGYFPGIERLGNYNQGGHKTRIGINEEYREALTDLANIILGIHDQDPALLEYGRQRAGEIISNPKDVASLLIKSYNFSPFTKADPAKTRLAIKIILGASPHPLTIEEVQSAYNDGTRQPLSYAGIGRYLTELETKKEARALLDRVDPSLKIERLVYYLAPQSE